MGSRKRFVDSQGNFRPICGGTCLKAFSGDDFGHWTFLGLMVLLIMLEGGVGWKYWIDMSPAYTIILTMMHLWSLAMFLLCTFTEPGIIPYRKMAERSVAVPAELTISTIPPSPQTQLYNPSVSLPSSSEMDEPSIATRMALESTPPTAVVLSPESLPSFSPAAEPSTINAYRFLKDELVISPDLLRLFYFVRYGKVESTEDHVQKFPDSINARNEEGNNALITAITYGQIGTLQVLIDNHANPLYEDQFGLNALHHASLNGSYWSIVAQSPWAAGCDQADYRSRTLSILGRDYSEGQGEYVAESDQSRPLVLLKDKISVLPKCTTCNILIPPRAGHCLQCNVCIRRFDHHCPWVSNCIGLRNYRYFIHFLITLMLHPFFNLIPTIHSFVRDYLYYHTTSVSNAVVKMFEKNVVVLIFEIVLLGPAFIVYQLLYFHLNLIQLNQTTNENVKFLYETGSPYSRGFQHNFYVLTVKGYDSVISQ